MTLRGTVHSWAEHESATMSAGGTPGVRSVQDEMTLHYRAQQGLEAALRLCSCPTVSRMMKDRTMQNELTQSTPQSWASPASTIEPSWDEHLLDGTMVTIRALQSQDKELERRFIEGLSPRSRRFRFLETMNSPSDALLAQLTDLDPLADVAYLATIGSGSEQREIGVARFSAHVGEQDCEFAITVSDEWQMKGLGSALMSHLVDAARARGVRMLHSSDSADNDSMRQFAAHLSFQNRRDPEDAKLVLYSVDLT